MAKKCQSSSIRDPKNYHLGHGLTPLKPVDIERNSSVSGILSEMERASFGARRLGEAAKTLELMCRDPDCFRVLTLSGAMTVAQMGFILELLIRKWFHAVVSTGALITHGLVQGIGKSHYKVPEGADDLKLYELGLNRVYDTVEPEVNLDELEEVVHRIFDQASRQKVLAPHEIVREIGKYLDSKLGPEAVSIVRTAFKRQVPIYIPAFTDSELGLDFCILRKRDALAGRKSLILSEMLDLEHYTDLIRSKVLAGQKLGIFTIGGGVPRNWAQQVGPHLDIRGTRLGPQHGATAKFHYALRIATAPEHEGGLSGCTYREGVSWGKFVPREEGGRQTEVFCDATYVLPFLIRGVMERLES